MYKGRKKRGVKAKAKKVNENMMRDFEFLSNEVFCLTDSIGKILRREINNTSKRS